MLDFILTVYALTAIGCSMLYWNIQYGKKVIGQPFVPFTFFNGLKVWIFWPLFLFHNV